jgi:uncharacterized protein with HEPN domain
LTLPERDLGYLADLLDYGQRAMLHASRTTHDDFLASEENRDAILHCVTMVGEIAGRLSDDVATELPQFDWRAMKNMRNFIVHEYDRVDVERVWRVVQEDVPAVVEALTRHLAQFP